MGQTPAKQDTGSKKCQDRQRNRMANGGITVYVSLPTPQSCCLMSFIVLPTRFGPENQ